MQVQEHVVERLVKVPAEAVGWTSLRGEMACPDCLITTYQPEMGLERARRIIHHILWQYPRLGIMTSWMTILRRIMQLPEARSRPVTVLGVDDFSFKRGRTFGTIFVNLSTHEIIDLLPFNQSTMKTSRDAQHAMHLYEMVVCILSAGYCFCRLALALRS